MSEFYHTIITEKSFELLQKLKRKFNFILIGGWAIFLYSKALKSKDIDIIIDYKELGKFKKEFRVFKNERLKKYEVKAEQTDIDIYLPFFSDLGILVEEIKNHAQSIEGFVVPIPEILLILKTFAYQDRKGTTKGRKDIIDIFSLICSQKIDWQKYKNLIEKYKLNEINQELKNLIAEQKSIPELDLLNHKISKLKEKTLSSF
jgi:hypothetical protein